MVLKNWKKSKFWREGYAWEKKDGKLNILISEGQFDGFDVVVWDIKNKKSKSRRNFKTFKKAQAYARSYMRSH